MQGCWQLKRSYPSGLNLFDVYKGARAAADLLLIKIEIRKIFGDCMVRNLITDRKHRDICQKLHALDQRRQNIKNEWLATMVAFQKHAKWLRILIRQQEKCNRYKHYKSVKLR